MKTMGPITLDEILQRLVSEAKATIEAHMHEELSASLVSHKDELRGAYLAGYDAGAKASND